MPMIVYIEYSKSSVLVGIMFLKNTANMETVNIKLENTCKYRVTIGVMFRQ